MTLPRLGIRTRLFLTSVGLLVVVGIASLFYIEHALVGALDQRIDDELVRAARAARAAILLDPGAPPDHLDAVADALGESLSIRVTVMIVDVPDPCPADGPCAGDARHAKVLGDSGLDGDALLHAQDHGDRQEVGQALATGDGRAQRRSSTLGIPMKYAALPLSWPDGRRGIVRTATPIEAIEEARAHIHLALFVASMIGLGVAVVMSYLAASWMTRTLRELLENAQAAAEGREPPHALSQGDEIGDLAQSIHHMAHDLAMGATTLARERDRFESILAGMSEAVLTLDEDQRVTLANPAAMSLLGLSASPVGRTLLEIVRAPALVEVVRGALAGASNSADVTLLGPSRRLILARGTPLRGAPGAVVVLHDVTEIRRLERVRQDFVANVSHELRTPVSIIQVNAETLLDGAVDDPDQARIFLEALLRNAERLSRLIADLLDISRFEAGSQTLRSERVVVAEVAQRTVDALRRAAQEQSITLRAEIDPSLAVLADDRALDQVLYNLIENAVKYMQEQGQVTLRARAAGDRVIIEVEDNGPGIAPQHRPRLFERFYRVDPGRSREMGGTGLGLAIVKHLVGAMGGQVGMRPASPRGSVFWIHLAAAASPAAEAQV